MQNLASSNDVQVADIQLSDLDQYIDYWHNADNTHLDYLGIDRNKLYPANKMREQIEYNIKRNTNEIKSDLSVLTIKYKGISVGVHELTDLIVGESAIMHAHIWSTKYQGKGIATISYIKAMGVYFKRFNLKFIKFETPKINTGANRIKEKLGIKQIGSSVINLPILKHSLETNSYVVSKHDLPQLINLHCGS